MENALRTSACAKINLTLHVVGRRSDGYHLLESVVAFAKEDTNACDHLSLTPGEDLKLSISGEMAANIGGPIDNLVIKAARLFAVEFPNAQIGSFHLVKHLPVASGIGGGSSDAAAALRLLAQHNRISQSDTRLLAIAKKLGSDVPMCLEQKARFVTGLGDELGHFLDGVHLSVVLINPGIPISTQEVFTRAGYELGKTITKAHHSALPEIFSQEEFLAFLKMHRNDLQTTSVSIVPEIQIVFDVFSRETNCLFSQMSGSGATVFGVYANSDEAENASQRIKSCYPDWWVVSTILS